MGTHTPARGRRPGRDTRVRAALDALRRIVQGLRLYGTRAERTTGLSGAQLFVLQQLAEAPAQSLNELAARTHTHQSSVSTVVTRLVARRLVTRRRAPEDGRRIVLELTAAGHSLLARAPETAQGRLIAVLEALPEADRQSLLDGLAALVSALGMDREPATLFFEPSDGSRAPLS